MSFPNSSFPLPMYAINKNLEIISVNQSAINTMTSGESFLELFETESRSKVETHLRLFTAVESLEVNAISSSGTLLLVDLYISWTAEDIGEVILVRKDDAIAKVSAQLDKLRARLADTNFELLTAKETAENLLKENIKLSSPFVEISDTAALVPIFGELDSDKSDRIALTLTQRAYNSTVEYVIIDFTAVGEIDQQGLSGFEKLVTMLQLLGFTVLVSGLHPKHAKEWSTLESTSKIKFVNSLRLAVESIVNSAK